MASISNTGKSITIAFSVEESDRLKMRGGEDWRWQVPEFSISEDGIGTLVIRPDMFTGRKIGKMTKNHETPERWMLVIPSTTMPLVPYFNKVPVDADFTYTEVTKFALPRSLPPLAAAKVKAARLAAAPRVRAEAVKPQPVAEAEPMTALAMIPPEPMRSNITLIIEGNSFVYDVPLMERIRIMGDLKDYIV